MIRYDKQLYFTFLLGNTTSSSTYEDDQLNWGPEFAIDGLMSMNSATGFFLSTKEDYPWFQLQLTNEQTVNGITISLRISDANTPWELEVRAGTTPIDSGFNGRIESNTLCQKFVTEKDVQEYKIMCSTPIISKFITIQVMGKEEILGIYEVDIISDDIVTDYQTGT